MNYRGWFDHLRCSKLLSKNPTETPEMALARVLEIPDDMPQKPKMLNKIGATFLSRFKRTRNECDMDNAVLTYTLAVNLLLTPNIRLVVFLSDYGDSMMKRYRSTGSVADIDRAILAQQCAVQHIAKSHKSMPTCLNNLGGALQTRFERAGNFADISEAISLKQKAIQLTPEGSATLPLFLSNLGLSLKTRFERTGELADISEAISLTRKSIQLTPEGNATLPLRLNNLGGSLQTRFQRTGELADMSEAILLKQKAIQLTPEGSATLPLFLSNLGLSLKTRFERTGEPADISESILLIRKSVQLTPEGHATLPLRLNNLGGSLQTRFQRTGELADMSEAILLKQKAIQLTPEGSATLPLFLSNLGLSLKTRFERTGEPADISESISLMRKSIQLTPEGHADLPLRLNNLGSSLQTRFESTGELADMSEAILLKQKAIQLTPEGSATLPIWLNNLGNSLKTRFERTGELADISEAISLTRKSVQLTPEGNVTLPIWLSNLGTLLQTRFESTGELAGILESISLQRISIQLTPEGHAALPTRLNRLGHSLKARFEHTSDEADIQSAIVNYRLSATSVSGPPSTRFVAAFFWVHLAGVADPSQLLEAYQSAILLISQIAGLEKTIQNRYTNLINIATLLSSAAATAIAFGNHSLALEWLEQGRCLVWSQLNDLRTPVDGLSVHHPSLANAIVRVSKALEQAGTRTEPPAFTEDDNMTMKMSIQDEAHTHIKLTQEWEQLLIKVRAIPQFENFLRPASCSTLLKVIPTSGYVVVINVHNDRSDALVLTSGASEPLHIALPGFPHEKAETLRRQLKGFLLDAGIRMRGSELDDIRGSRRYMPGIADILRQLWMLVVKPILDGVGYSVPVPNIPRIWWCVTGPLAFLPLHAAGIYSPAGPTSGTYTTLSDFAVSSYTPTVWSLVEKKQNFPEKSHNKKGLLAISQPDTPGQCRIPGTTTEVMAIQRLLNSYQVEHLRLASGDATVNRVKDQMDAYSCIHFACHASQNTTNTLQSGFCLYDGRLELSDIIKKHLLGADLAFLSACQTSSGDEKLSEEAVHLAGGMLAAGYRGVVATMWSINDSYGPIIAEEFYKNLLSHGAEGETGLGRLSSDGAAYALHYATQQARKKLDNSEWSLLTWVPYVHFGI